MWSPGTRRSRRRAPRSSPAPQWEGWNGALAVAVLKNTELRVMFLDGPGTTVTSAVVPPLLDLGVRLRSAVQGPDGNLYLTTDETAGAVWKVTPFGPAHRERRVRRDRLIGGCPFASVREPGATRRRPSSSRRRILCRERRARPVREHAVRSVEAALERVQRPRVDAAAGEVAEVDRVPPVGRVVRDDVGGVRADGDGDGS